MKKVLITGAAGFIGFHLASDLASKGHAVVGLDNFNDYYSPQLKRDRAALLKARGVTVVEGDLCDLAQLEDLVQNQGTTHLVNFAAQAGVRYSLSNPQAYVRSNLEGFVNVLEVCRAHPEIKLVYASSSSVYGLNDKTPFSVDDRTDRQASLYGATKKTNELMAQTYHHLYGISTVGLRFFTVYGPWGRPDMAYYSFTEAILRDEPIQIFNHGKMQRDFTYIDDIVAGAAAALDLEPCCEIFNLGNNQPVELGRFIEILEDTLGKKAEKVMLPMQKGDVVATYADITHAQKKLGFMPTTPLEEGIPRFVEWYRGTLS